MFPEPLAFSHHLILVHAFCYTFLSFQQIHDSLGRLQINIQKQTRDSCDSVWCGDISFNCAKCWWHILYDLLTLSLIVTFVFGDAAKDIVWVHSDICLLVHSLTFWLCKLGSQHHLPDVLLGLSIFSKGDTSFAFVFFQVVLVAPFTSLKGCGHSRF